MFAGCGGLDLGFHGGFSFLKKSYTRNKFRLVWANDIDEAACETYAHNVGDRITCGDIGAILDGASMGDNPLPFPESVDIVLGGFPCQDFSHAGKRRGFDSTRGLLYEKMLETVRRTHPKIFLAENVKGLITLDNGAAIRQIADDFAHLGYHVSYRLFNTADYGVPQRRERVLIIGTRTDILPPYDFPEPVTSECWVSLREAIGDLADIPEGRVPNHHWSKARKNAGQGNGTVDPDLPGPTMRAEHHGNIEFHWNGKRRLSAREAARIQSFPDDFAFYPSTSAAYRQIGNAVAPVFAWHQARHMQKFLDKHLKRL